MASEATPGVSQPRAPPPGPRICAAPACTCSARAGLMARGVGPAAPRVRSRRSPPRPRDPPSSPRVPGPRWWPRDFPVCACTALRLPVPRWPGLRVIPALGSEENSAAVNARVCEFSWRSCLRTPGVRRPQLLLLLQTWSCLWGHVRRSPQPRRSRGAVAPDAFPRACPS